jgi:Undecaprenyl-phosphate glucose phosphotransferase
MTEIILSIVLRHRIMVNNRERELTFLQMSVLMEKSLEHRGNQIGLGVIPLDTETSTLDTDTNTFDMDSYGTVPLPVDQRVADFRQTRKLRTVRTESTPAVPIGWAASAAAGKLPGMERSSPTVAHWGPDLLRRSKGSAVLTPEMLVGIVRMADFLTVVAASAAAFSLYLFVTSHLGVTRYPVAELERYFLTSLFGAALFVAGFQYLEGYTLQRLSMLKWQLTRSGATWAITVAALLLTAFVGKVSQTYSRGWAVAWILTTLTGLFVQRGIVRYAIEGWTRRGYLARYVVIVGASEDGERLIAKLQTSQDKSIAICGVFDDRKSRVPNSVCGYEVLGDTDDLVRLARQFPIEEVIIALPLSAEWRLKEIVEKLKALPADLRVSVEAMAEKFSVRGLSYVGDVPFLAIADRPIKHWSAVAKWIEDKVLSSILLLLMTPLMLIIALLIKLDSPGPVLFVQERFGFNNNVIRVLKFRSMYVDRGDLSGAQRTVKNDPRTTRVGRILRLLSLDELPQLLNVLRGEMSLIGPRAHAVTMKAGDRLYPEAIDEYVQRHRVKPGITGWAQVNGYRGEVDTIEKARGRVEHDLFYIENWSIWLDLKIAAMTFLTVLSRENAY